MPFGSAWSFITDNEAFSRARFRGVTWAKLTANDQSFDTSRRRSVADVWFYRMATYEKLTTAYTENDPTPWVGNLFLTPRATAIHVQTVYLIKGAGMLDLQIGQKVGARKLKPDYWGDFPVPAGARSDVMRGVGDEAWQLSDMVVLPILDEEHEFHAWDQRRLARQVLQFDQGYTLSENAEDFGWKVVLMEPQIIQVNGPQHRLVNPPARRDDLGEEIQVKITKQFHWEAAADSHITSYAKAWMVGVKIHELIGV